MVVRSTSRQLWVLEFDKVDLLRKQTLKFKLQPSNRIRTVEFLILFLSYCWRYVLPCQPTTCNTNFRLCFVSSFEWYFARRKQKPFFTELQYLLCLRVVPFAENQRISTVFGCTNTKNLLILVLCVVAL